MANKNYFLIACLLIMVLTACDQSFKPAALDLEQEKPVKVSLFGENQIPQDLSNWGIFYITDGQLKLTEQAIPYHLNTPLFSDYAHKFRAIWLPQKTIINVQKNGTLEFPTGTILVKTFYYPRESFGGNLLTAKQIDTAHSSGSSINLRHNQVVETRLLVKQSTGWQALPYVWNKDQTEASLEITGASQKIKLVGNKTQEFNYMVPDANQCKGCHVTNHSNGKLLPIGPKVKHLDLDYDYSPSLTQNQLERLKQLGKITDLPKTFETNNDWRLRENNINHAARSYLDINCAHCHNPDGPADTSALHLNKENLQKAHLGICKTPVAAGKGTGDRPYDITPGKAQESIMIFRMESNDPSIAMPELGRAIIHEEGVELIKEWINQLDGHCEIPQA